MKIIWLCILAAFLGGCVASKNEQAAQTPPAINELLDYEVEQSAISDAAAINGYLLASNNDHAAAAKSFYEAFISSGDPQLLKEAMRSAFLVKDPILGELLEAADGLFESDSEIERLIIGHYIIKNDLSAAKTKAQNLIARDKSAPSYTILGTILVLDNQPKAAKPHLKKAFELDPSEENVTRYAELLALRLNEEKAAINILKKHAQKHGCVHPSCAVLATALLKSGQNKKAAEYLVRLYETTKNRQFLLTALGAYINIKDLKSAASLLETYRFNDEMLLGIYAQMRDFNNAIRLSDDLFLATNNYDFRIKSAIARYELATQNGQKISDFELASIAAIFKESEEAMAGNAIYLNFYGYLLIDHNLDIKKGLELVLKAHELEPSANFIIDSVAWGYYKMGQCDEAKKWYEKLQNDAAFMDDDEAKEHLKAILKCQNSTK